MALRAFAGAGAAADLAIGTDAACVASASESSSTELKNASTTWYCRAASAFV